MQFASIGYLLFLTLGAVVYFALPGVRSRTVWLLATSYAFYYSLSATWTVVLLGITTVGYISGLLFQRTGVATPGEPIPTKARWLLGGSISLVLATLFAFKYVAFASRLLNAALPNLHASWNIGIISLALPIGISFWTFQTIAYLTDIARGRLTAEKNPLSYALFIAFFPQVTAGPIARGEQLLSQLAVKHRFDYLKMRSALLLMLRGFFKKLVVADPLGVIVGNVYGAPHAYHSRPLVLFAATLAFSIQIYCDFSGYTDIVRGSAGLFGIDLLPNFDRPYFSKSIREFWRRWHMSLMSWFKDYIYIPLGGSRRGKWRRYANILAVFLISGLWHGAGLTFVFWGLLNGAYQILGEIGAPLRDRVARALRIKPDGVLRNTLATVTTFSLVTFAWVFFRANSLRDAVYILRAMANMSWHPGDINTLIHLSMGRSQLIATLIGAIALFTYEWFSMHHDLPAMLFRQNVAVRWVAYQTAILSVVIFGYYGSVYSAAAFAYFKF